MYFYIVVYILLTSLVSTPIVVQGVGVAFGTIALLKMRHSLSELVLFVFLCISLILSWFFVGFYSDNYVHAFVDEVRTNVLIRWFLSLLSAYIALKLIRQAFSEPNESKLTSALEVVLTVHLAAFIIQALFWNITGVVIDFSSLLGGQEARYQYREYVRLTGLLLEPSTYASVIFALSATLSLLYYSKSNELSLGRGILLIASAISALASLATASIIYGSILLVTLSILFLKKVRVSRVIITLTVLASAILFSVLNEELIQVLLVEKFYASSGIRVNLVSYMMIERDIFLKLVGSSLMGIEQYLYDSTIPQESGSRYYSSLNDAGTLVFGMAYFGYIFFVLSIIISIYILRKSVPVFLLFVGLWLIKISFTHFMFFLPLFAILLFKKPALKQEVK
ncbi:hypothetical protein [Aliidiomarina indica]|uniref:hypothetical protein n=1 Tax=Aliidiomarina indica TaxID=2749147 RepID=UPI00188EA03F|nr:hypothetical protein [Aliidiomarina indica]